MTLSETLQQMDCDPERVLSLCPRGFANEWTVYPIPAQFADDAETLVERADPQNPGEADFLAIADLSKTARVSVLQWTNYQTDPHADTRTPEVLWHSWAEMTRYL